MIVKLRQMLLAKMVHEGMTYGEIARVECVKPKTIKVYIEDIADRIRGDLTAKTKVQVWYRMRCGLSPLTGEPLQPLSNSRSERRP